MLNHDIYVWNRYHFLVLTVVYCSKENFHMMLSIGQQHDSASILRPLWAVGSAIFVFVNRKTTIILNNSKF